MTRLVTLTGFSLRELWIGFRLLTVMLAFALSGLAVAIIPGAGWRIHAVALAGALALASGLIAGAVAGDRGRGFAGWLVARSVPRATVATGWLLAASILLLAGLALALATAAALGGGAEAAGGTAALPGLVLAVDAAGVAAAGLAVTLGLLVPSRLALPITSLVVAAWLGAIVLVAPPSATLPGSGFALLADLGTEAPGPGVALRAAGVGLAAAAIAWAAAIVVAGRVDL